MTDDPYLRPLLDAVNEFHVVIGVQDQMRQLILKAYQQGRARVIRDVAEQERKDNSVPPEPVMEHLRKIRQHVSAIELDAIRQKDAGLLLSPEQIPLLVEKISDALMKQARRNR